MKFIKEFTEGDRISTQFLVSNVTRGVNNIGSAYLNIELRDCTGTIPAKKWEIEPDDEKTIAVGNIIAATVEVIRYRESLQAKVITARYVDPSEIDLVRFVSAPPIKKEVLIEEFNSYRNSIKQSECKALLEYFIKKYESTLFIYPAASSIHHEYSSGLLMHIVSMCKMGEFFANNYKNINRDLLITGIMLHDIGKLTELEGPVVFHYSLEGKLIGHISIMAAEIKEATNKLGLKGEIPLLLQHMILSHHGQLEYGSPVLPLTVEALVLNLVDNADSKMTILNKAIDEVQEGEFTTKIFPLDGRQFYKHK